MIQSKLNGFAAFNLEPDKEERGYNVLSLLLKSRIIFLGTAINDIAANLIISQFLLLEQENSEKEIKLYINSPGGEVGAGLAIYDTIQLIRPDVATYCVGTSASFATILLAAGTKGKRYALPNATVHMHQAWGAMQGQVSDMKIAAQHMIQLQERIYNILNEHTGQSKEKLSRDCDRDFYLTAQEAMEYGIIDKVLTKAPKGGR